MNIAAAWGEDAERHPWLAIARSRGVALGGPTIFRDPTWRKTDAAGALRMSPEDAKRLGVATGDTVRLTTRAGSGDVVAVVSETMQRGHLSLPNGLGLTLEGGSTTGLAPNELTRAVDRDPWVGTPWHKHVAAQVERVAT